MKNPGKVFVMMVGIAVALVPMTAIAQDATGTWTSRIENEGYVQELYWADYYYEPTLTLYPSGNGVSGNLQGTIMSVDIKEPGWVDPADVIGDTISASVDGSLSGSTLTLTVHDPGGDYTLVTEVSGDTITGSGEYLYQATQTMIGYRIDLVRGSSDGNGGGNGGSGPTDSDGDGLRDSWELLHFGNLLQTGSGDPDNDGYTNLEEIEENSDPNDPIDTPEDTDDDGLRDSWEILYFGTLDRDGEGDYDGDGFTDSREYTGRYDPTDPEDHPNVSPSSGDSADNTTLYAALATLGMVAIFAVAIYANHRRLNRPPRKPRDKFRR